MKKSDKLWVVVDCPRCGEPMRIHRARLENWIHVCKGCREHFMVNDQ